MHARIVNLFSSGSVTPIGILPFAPGMGLALPLQIQKISCFWLFFNLFSE